MSMNLKEKLTDSYYVTGVSLPNENASIPRSKRMTPALVMTGFDLVARLSNIEKMRKTLDKLEGNILKVLGAVSEVQDKPEYCPETLKMLRATLNNHCDAGLLAYHEIAASLGVIDELLKPVDA